MDEWLEKFAWANLRRSGDIAHDLKTPLNVAVLNLELLRMRLAKLGAGSDEKIAGYAAAIETELRRLGNIFDAFFLLSVPPANEELATIDLTAVVREAAAASGNELSCEVPPTMIVAHDSRMRQAYKLFFEGASRVLSVEPAATAASAGKRFEVSIAGKTDVEDLELLKIFKFYYTDAAGSPDLSLAAARLIAEAYGGELNAVRDHDKVVLRLSFPLGDP